MELNPNATIAAQGFATGPILTSSGAVTRNANQLSATIPSCANPSLLAIGTPYAPVTYPTQQMAAEADDGASHYMQVSRAATTGLANFGISGTTQTIAGAWAQSTSGKIAEFIGGGNMSGRFNGGSPQTTAATLSQASTKLQIGSQGGSLNFNGVLSRVAVACNGASLLNR